MTKPALALILPALLGACSLADMYDKEYVIYDGRSQAAPGSPERVAQDAALAQREAERADPVANTPGPVDGRLAAVSAEGDVDRIFVLENLFDELDRALRANVGDPSKLHEKRAQLAAEIAWRKAEVGPLYERARALRVERLAAFPVVLK